MNKYIIIHGQLREIPEDELMHWKYIKREKVNGKWKYYYDQSELDAAKASANKKRNAYERASDKYTKDTTALLDSNLRVRQLRNQLMNASSSKDKARASLELTRASEEADKVKQTQRNSHTVLVRTKQYAEEAEKAYNKNKIVSFPARTVAKGAVKVANILSGNSKQDKKTDWEESKERATNKAMKEATAKDGMFIKDRHGLRERGKTEFTDSDKLLSGKTSVIVGDTEFREIRRGKLERFADTAKEYVKDRLGYDERDAAVAAISKYDYAKTAEKNYVDEANATINFMGTVNPRDGSIRYTDAQKKEIERIERTKQMLRDQTAKAEKEAAEASEAYLNTTVGKIEKARNKRKKR